jgi:hypothetical protein
MGPGWNSATDILLRGAWMTAVLQERERCAKELDDLAQMLDLGQNMGAAQSVRLLAAAIRKGS